MIEKQIRENVYCHHGDLGDTLASVPTMLSMGPGELCLYPAPGKVRQPYSLEKVKNVAPFFESQPGIRRCYFADRPPAGQTTVILDRWRWAGWRGRYNLSDRCSNAFHRRHIDRMEQWLFADPHPVAEFIINRTERYTTPDFPWRAILDRVRDVAFVGTSEEHRTFTDRFGHVPYYPTPTLKHLADVIAGANFFVGNQSTPLWLAIGMLKPLWCEFHPRHDNCHWERPNAFYGSRDWAKVDGFLSGRLNYPGAGPPR